MSCNTKTNVVVFPRALCGTGSPPGCQITSHKLRETIESFRQWRLIAAGNASSVVRCDEKQGHPRLQSNGHYLPTPQHSTRWSQVEFTVPLFWSPVILESPEIMCAFMIAEVAKFVHLTFGGLFFHVRLSVYVQEFVILLLSWRTLHLKHSWMSWWQSHCLIVQKIKDLRNSRLYTNLTATRTWDT